jgi:hypothetical protein
MIKRSQRCYCAFCRSHRRIYRKRHVSLVDIGLAALASFLLSSLIWQDFDPRAIVFFAFGLGLAEIAVLLRWRMSIACPRCGFDPVLYKRNPEAAVQRVQRHRLRDAEDPMSVFLSPPRLPSRPKSANAVAPQRPAPQAERPSTAPSRVTRPSPPAGKVAL